jgi:hypothetical protein
VIGQVHALAGAGIAGLAEWAGAARARSAGDGLSAIVGDPAALAGANLGERLGDAPPLARPLLLLLLPLALLGLLLAHLAAVPVLALLLIVVAVLATLAPVLGNGL